MRECYNVIFNGQSVGETELYRDGLYWKIRCVCRLEQGPMYRLTAQTDTGNLDLGTLIVIQNEYILDTRISAKKADKFVAFHVCIPGDEKVFTPLYSDRAFEKFEVLERAVFARRDNQPGLLY